MKNSQVVVLPLIALGIAFSNEAHAQGYACESRMVESTLDRSLTQRFGPTAEQQLQSFAATGEGVKMTFERLSVETLGSNSGAVECAARVRIWRADTGEIADHDVRYSIITQGGQTIVRLKK